MMKLWRNGSTEGVFLFGVDEKVMAVRPFEWMTGATDQTAQLRFWLLWIIELVYLCVCICARMKQRQGCDAR